jgi:hypothetical protein
MGPTNLDPGLNVRLSTVLEKKHSELMTSLLSFISINAADLAIFCSGGILMRRAYTMAWVSRERDYVRIDGQLFQDL